MSLLAQLAMQLAVRIVSSGHHGGVTFYTAYAKPLEWDGQVATWLAC